MLLYLRCSWLLSLHLLKQQFFVLACWCIPQWQDCAPCCRPSMRLNPVFPLAAQTAATSLWSSSTAAGAVVLTWLLLVSHLWEGRGGDVRKWCLMKWMNAFACFKQAFHMWDYKVFGYLIDGVGYEDVAGWHSLIENGRFDRVQF